MTSLLPDDDEHLTTGWEPDVDAADSVVRASVLVHASWAIARARSLGRPWRDGPEWAAGHCGDRGAMTNWVVLKQPLLDLDVVMGDVDELFPRSRQGACTRQRCWPRTHGSPWRTSTAPRSPRQRRTRVTASPSSSTSP